MLELAGYQIGKKIYDGTRTLVYHAKKEENARPVILKKLRKEAPNFGEIMQLRHQYALTKNLDVPGIVKVIALEKYGNAYVLVMEDVGGVSLSEYFSDRPLNLDEFLPAAIALIEILENLHKQRIIHKDIKPANILINPETKEIFLIDLSIASLLPKETQQLQNLNQLEGTLAYISPEQTGRMNRGIDYRTDFYGLGVTFYQLLTGQLPFDSSDAMELVHCHIAKIPTPPHQINPQIPEVISDMVMKLMAKNAEGRYQSARGIKRDLDLCWQQWQEEGSIRAFELGTRDISDRFFIPEQLYGRETEVQTLLDAFDRVGAGTTEMMLVAGFSGIGKTAIVNEVRKPIVEKRGYFIKGKFDQFNRDIPLSAFVQAFRDLMGQLLGETDGAIKRWQGEILAALGEQAQVIIEVIPELENIIGQQPEVNQLSGSAAQNRFNLLFGKFIRVFATTKHPLVIFLDDLQWAEEASLKLMELLIDRTENAYLLLVAAYRDNEVYISHPLMLTLEEIAKNGARLNTITLSALSQKDINYLVADTLSCALDVALPLTELVYQKAKGNPFFSNQFFKSLYEDGLIYFDLEAHYWQCDIAKVKEMAIADDVVEFMASRISKLPPPTQKVLKFAACIGNQFDLATLAIVSEDYLAETAADLWQALQEGLILPTSKIYKFFTDLEESNLKEAVIEEAVDLDLSYKFLHDRVQQAAYSLIPEDKKKATHLKIGRQLWENLSESEQENQLFTIVNHLNAGGDLILDRGQRNRAARLNLQGSQKAKASVAYEACRRYCYAGQQFLGEESWQENYSLQFALAIATIEAEYFNHNLPLAEELSRETLDKARTLLDRIKVRELQILFEINQNQMNEAISLAREVLRLLGINLPARPQEITAEIKLLRQEIAMPTEEIANLATLQGVNDEEKLAAIRVLTNASSAAYIANPTLFPAIILHTVRHCIKYGHSPLAASAYSWYGALLCGVYEDIEAGYEFGKLSLQLLEQFNARALTAKVSNMFNVFIRPWKEALNLAIAELPTAIQSGFDNGDIEYAFYAAVHYCNYLFYSGNPLEWVREAQERYLPLIVKAQYKFHENFLRINQQVVINLLGETDEPQYLQGLVLDGESSLSQWLENNIVFLVLCFYQAQMRLAYLFEDNIGALVAGDRGWQYRQAAMGTLYVSEYNFYYSLALLADNLTGLQSDRIAANQSQLKIWAQFSPTNFQHKYDLVEAEWHRVLEKKIEAMELYDRAIVGAGENGYIHEEALANELAAKFYLEWGKEKIARSYIIDAYYGYARWGSLAKVKQLEGRYPKLLAAVINQKTTDLDTNFTLASISSSNVLSSTKGASTFLDFASAVKASQAISQVLDLEELLSKLMEAAMENAGASKGALLLPVGGALAIEALADYPQDAESIAITSVGRSLRFEETQELPVSLINTVWRARKMLVLNNAARDDRFLGDRYLSCCQPQSVLCTPLLNRGKLIAILYLENRLAAGAFASDRLSLLDILCSQAAISLENARLYKQSQNYSLQLEQYLQQLQEAQLQLVQSEKMATIGQLLAGIAHEINNPVGFIYGNLTFASDDVRSLIDLLNMYREDFSNPSNRIEEKIEEMELDYLLEDLPELIDSMKEGTKRIAEISKSMRTFSRSDTGELIPFNLHDGIDSTLLILKHRLKANPNRPQIEIVKNYGSLPEVNCYPGQLNQVFMNLIANAIDAFDEGNSQCSFKEIKSQRNRITITTEIDEKKQNAIVRIKDNGPGVSEEVKHKIFDRLFTTKGVGKGTGLGLSISRQIVEEKHGGTLGCTSEVGEGTEFAIALSL